MFEIEFKFNIGQTVYYVQYGAYVSARATVEQGVIQGFHIRKQNNSIVVVVDFMKSTNAPIENVSENRDDIQAIVDKYNSSSIEERIR